MVTADAVLTAPAGVVLLARLEGLDANAMPLDELVALAVEAAFRSAGPWSSSTNEELLRAYAHAPARGPIAEAVAERFSEIEDADFAKQEWWHTNDAAEGWFATRRFERHDELIYDNGQFTFAGVWTATAPPPAAHDALATAWELHNVPVSRWRLPVRDGARIYTINEPSDWVALVSAYPLIPTRPNCAWELPGMNDHLRDPALASASHGRAARNEMDHLLMPQWSRVAQDYDGVHLTWPGWLTSEGFVSDTPDGGVTILRYWFSERTLWLNDVFGEPEPVETSDADRASRDRAVLRAMLGR